MDEEIFKQIFDEIFTSLEPLETQNVALVRFLKAKGMATDEDLAPFLEQAGNAANVRWLGVRLRTEALISNAMRPTEQSAETPSQNTERADQTSAKTKKDGPQGEKYQEEKDQNKDAANKEEPGSRSQQRTERNSKSAQSETPATENKEDSNQNAA